MYMKRYISFLGLAAILSGCASSGSSNGGELIGVGGMAWGEPTPYGMVLVKRGSFEMGHNESDSLWGTRPDFGRCFLDGRYRNHQFGIQTIRLLGTRLDYP